MGDMNAKHHTWNSKINNYKGLQLHTMAEDNNLIVIGPDEPTHIHLPTRTTDILDIAILKNITTTPTLETIDDIASDHLPIEMNLDIDPQSQPEERTGINWYAYKANIQITNTTIHTRRHKRSSHSITKRHTNFYPLRILEKTTN